MATTKKSNPGNLKATPIPVVPRTMKIVNPDGTVTRSGQLLLEQIQTAVSGGGGGGGGGGQPGDATGPVTGFTAAHEVGVRYAGNVDRLVHMTVGFIPIVPTPQPVTYLISSDNGATWVWIGSQRMLAAGQQLKVDRLAPGQNSLWKVACVSGNLGGDPTPLADADLETLYPGIVRSNSFPVAGLATPPAGYMGITATIGVCSNVISADGLTQYGRIPGVVYHDPVASTDFFVRLTVQIYDKDFNPLAAEQAYGGTQITGGSHTENALLITYIPGLAWVRYRFYLANRNSQGPGDFHDPTTNTLQLVQFNDNPVAANHYDVPITIPPFTPIDPSEAFNVLSVTASEVGPKYQDVEAGLHTTIGVIPVIDVDYSKPRTVTIWFDFGTGEIVWQGWFALTAPGEVVRIGDSTLGTDGVRRSGNIWVPANVNQGNWIVYCGAGRIEKGIDATAYKSFPFTVIPVAACLPNGTTAAEFVPDPTTGDPIIYSLWDPGIWYWNYYELTWTPPNLNTDPNFWFTMITVQKGATIAGVWTPAPDSEGINESPTLDFLGRVHDQVMQLPGLANDQTNILKKFGAKPATWVIPPLQNPDMTPNVYREFRFLLYNVSRLGTDRSGSGGPGTYTLQTSCWPGGTDHFILVPMPQDAALDIRAANPVTIKLPLTGGNGLPLTVEPGAIDGTYLADQAVHANNMAANSITVANDALSAESVIDPKIKTVGINKVTYGTSIFAGDVILSRGVGNPVIYLKVATSGPDPRQNPTGIYLFGQGDGTTGTTGLTTQPYVVVQSTAIGLFQGGTAANPGGSVYVDAAAAAITIYNRTGDTSFPYFTVNASGLVLVNGTNSFAVNANAMTFIDRQFHNRIDINSAGISIANGLNADGTLSPTANRVIITSSQMQFQLGGLPRITIDSNAGITLSNGGTSSIVISATTASIINGTFHYVSGGVTVDINPAISTPLGTANGMAIQSGGNAVVLTSSAVSVTTTAGSTGSFSATGISWSGPAGQASIGISVNQIYLQDASANAVKMLANGLSFSIAGGAFQTVIDSNLVWRHSVQCTDHIIGSDFGIDGVGFGVGTPGAPRTFTTADGRTATVIGGIITALVP